MGGLFFRLVSNKILAKFQQAFMRSWFFNPLHTYIFATGDISTYSLQETGRSDKIGQKSEKSPKTVQSLLPHAADFSRRTSRTVATCISISSFVTSKFGVMPM